ncbi:YeiH family protein [Marinobacterium rhizophilum]|uniref:Sulfate exporter family transporter n=1 Tax=Marinobacterium rhizophilum TaxID=420402 RepID=A0ABY5HIR8_9GAMM|nr:putative sulfate exporter family transporter [Marinobacterium rhizophilum]UTW11177.1 putative sulfate exporter family transporter [Marinobacterium rhizophilum]
MKALAEHPIERLSELKQRYFPGLCVAVTIGIAATFLAQRYGAPAMLMGLLLGLAFNFLSDEPRVVPGIELAAKTLLRLGVAMLGLRITFSDVLTLGWPPLLMVCSAVLLTIGFGIVMARLLGFGNRFGTLTGGSVAICGASAAMAISSVLPQNEQTKKDTLFTVISVTTLSTVAMVLYPMISHELGLTPAEAGLFLGGTIHDVAQVVGAGYSVSSEVGDLSTFVKLLRVAMLVPIVLVIGVVIRRSMASRGEVGGGSVGVPGFLIGFVVLFTLNSLGWMPQMIVEPMADSASWLLLTAIAALGVRTSLKEILTVGIKPVLLVVSETIFIMLLVLGFISFS